MEVATVATSIYTSGEMVVGIGDALTWSARLYGLLKAV